MINSKDFKVRENLWHALNRLQVEEEASLIWIDAICINQEDNHERSEQVRMMRTIYEKAHHVCVWLGLEKEHSHQAFRLLKDLNRCAGNDELILERLKHRDIHTDLHALASLYSRKYWYRIWITQELVLANHIWIFCGRDCVSWAAIEDTRNSIGNMSSNSEAYRLFYKNTDSWSYASLKSQGPSLIAATREYFQTERLRLFETVCEHHTKRASDPRDMIYGLLGIADEEKSRHVEIDYSKPVTRVYIDFAKQVILDSGVLDIVLGADNAGSNMVGLPSWVPDWSKLPHAHLKLQPLGKSTCWNASGTKTT